MPAKLDHVFDHENDYSILHDDAKKVNLTPLKKKRETSKII